MAINPLNFLIEIINSPTLTVEAIKHGLSHSKVGDCFDFDDWQAMYHAESLAEMKEIAGNLRPKYENLYFELGKPKTAEAWNEAWNPSRYPVR
jgi:hypothetical protein